MELNVFDAIVFSITLILGIKGFFNGIIKEIAGLVGIVLGVYLASNYYIEVGDYINESIFKIPNESAINIVGFVAVFVLTWIIITLIGILLSKVMAVSKLTIIDKIGGVLFSSGKFFIIVSIIITMLSQIELVKNSLSKINQNSVLFPIMVKIGEQIVHFNKDEFQKQIDDVKNRVQKKIENSVKDKIETTKETIANGISEQLKPEIDKTTDNAVNKNKGE